MTLLHQAAASTVSFVQYYGVGTSSTTGQVAVTYGGNIAGTQIFGYTYLSGVDLTTPVRATAAAANLSGTGSLDLSYSAAAIQGDLAIAAANYNVQNGTTITITPSDSTLYMGAAGATFSGSIILDENLDDGAYTSSITFAGGTNRELGGGLILAADNGL